MAKRKNQEMTWVERQNFYLDDSATLIQYLLFAVWKNCKRLGWDMEYERRSESFYRVDVWLPREKGVGYAIIYFDTVTPGNLITFDNIANAHEAKTFIKSLAVEIREILDEWERKKGKAEGQRVNYLLTGKPAILVDGKQSVEQPKRQPAATAMTKGKGGQAKSKRGPRRYSRAEKIAKRQEWENLDRDANPITLDQWLEIEFGEESGVLVVPPSTFYGWPKS
jgi:hypothetical protein